jgi:hypothetical protein
MIGGGSSFEVYFAHELLDGRPCFLAIFLESFINKYGIGNFF